MSTVTFWLIFVKFSKDLRRERHQQAKTCGISVKGGCQYKFTPAHRQLAKHNLDDYSEGYPPLTFGTRFPSLMFWPEIRTALIDNLKPPLLVLCSSQKNVTNVTYT